MASLGTAYGRQLREQNELTQQLPLAQHVLTQYSSEEPLSQKMALEKQLSQIESQLETAKNRLSPAIKSNDITDTLFEVAKASNVQITEITSSSKTSGDLEGISCSILSLTVIAQGDVTSLIYFATALSNKLTTCAIQAVKIEVPEVFEEDAGFKPETAIPSANIQVVIYLYEGY